MEIEHSSHPQHLLTLCDYAGEEPSSSSTPTPDQTPNCYGCDRPIAPQSSIYTCKTCNFYLHKPCAELPSVLNNHPFHSRHPLTLKIIRPRPIHSCTFCKSLIIGFNFCCDACCFYLHSHCASQQTNIKFEDGGHLFFLRKTEPRTIYHCSMCSDFGMDTHLFGCVIPSCPRSFHFHCAPLPFPEVVTSYYHYHPLTYTKSFVQDGVDEHYCDLCEYSRNPKLPVYLCKECEYAAHVSCVVSEDPQLLPSILEEYEKGAKFRDNLTNNVRLENINGKIRAARDEEKRLALQLEKITARLEMLKATRVNYISSVNVKPEVSSAECSTSSQALP